MVKARAMHYSLYKLFKVLFADTNPIPVKEALALMGRIEPVFRLPLCETTPEIREKIKTVLEEKGFLK
jgi:4-hydroxy-tetrahydrodipicolinate synthase